MKFKVKQVHCHPKHNGKHHSGFDYAIAFIDIDEEPEISHFDSEHYATSMDIKLNSKACFLDKEDIKKAINCEVSIAGYPARCKGERSVGKAFKGSGTIKFVRDTGLGGEVAYYNIVTSPGMSGSPVSIRDRSFYPVAEETQNKQAES